MKKVYGSYKGWSVVLIKGWNGDDTTFFIIAPGPDPDMIQDKRPSYDEALSAAKKAIIYEARNGTH